MRQDSTTGTGRPIGALSLALVAALFIASLPAAAATRVFIGTWSGSQATGGQVLEFIPGTGLQDVTPTGGIGAVWDLAAIDGELWATSGDGRVFRYDGASWTLEHDFHTTAVGVDDVGGTVHVSTFSGVWRRESGGAWANVASMATPARAVASEGHDGRPMLFLGDNGHDEFWSYDPDGVMPCNVTCPSSTGACSAGCFGGSCIYSMTGFDEGSGSLPYAGAWNGRLYRWNRANRSFDGLPSVPSSPHVQALVERDGRLWAGGSNGRLWSSAVPSSSSWTLERDFTDDFPISALFQVEETGELWVGHGGVPYGFARSFGTSMVQVFDGSSWTPVALPNSLGRGVLSIAALVDDAPSVSCDPGAYGPLECAGELTPLLLDGGGTILDPPSLSAEYSWSGGFVEGLADGLSPLVHFAGPGTYEIELQVDAGVVSGSCTVEVVVEDTIPPELLGLPGDATVSCDEIPAPAEPEAVDLCDAEASLSFVQTEEAGDCPDEYLILREWTAVDASGNEASGSQFLTVIDDEAPLLAGVPEDQLVACEAVPPPASPSASDDCDPDPELDFVELRIDGPCPHSYQLQRTWSAVDRCGNLASDSQLVEVQDDVPPSIVGVPPDAVVPCDDVPAPASPSVEDSCDPDPQLLFSELRIDGPCPGTYTLVRTWTATDACGNVAVANRTLDVVDETPPVVIPGDSDLTCLWPPAHGYACYRRADFEAAVSATDDCSEPISWRLDGCASDQEEDGLGDGHTEPDCLVDPTGEWICVRAERTGLDPEGRRYAVAVVATDACGNESESTVIGRIHVPHDSRNRPRDCHDRPSALIGRGDPLPF